MKIVVFGGGGFIGSHVVDRLIQEGYEIRIFEHPRVQPYRLFSDHEKVEWISGDFLSSHDVSEALVNVDVVLHLISFTLPKNSNDDILYDIQTNLSATFQLLSSMSLLGVKRLIFVSSGGTVYGEPKYIPIDEEHPTDPLVSYGITKLAIEKYLYLFERLYGIRSFVLRVSNAYGPRQRIQTSQGAAMVFLQRALNNLPVEIWGDGSIVRDYIYVSDIAEAFVKVLSYAGNVRKFNISSGVGTSLIELLDEISLGTNKTIRKNFLAARPFDVKNNVLANQLAKKELGWIPQVSLQNGLLKTIDWVMRTQESGSDKK